MTYLHGRVSHLTSTAGVKPQTQNIMGYADNLFKAKELLNFAELVGGREASVDRSHTKRRDISSCPVVWVFSSYSIHASAISHTLTATPVRPGLR
jgi:hypothetical protein